MFRDSLLISFKQGDSIIQSCKRAKAPEKLNKSQLILGLLPQTIIIFFHVKEHCQWLEPLLPSCCCGVFLALMQVS